MDTKSNLLERPSKLNSTYLETKVQLSINTIVLHFQFDLLSKFCRTEKIVPIKYLTGSFEASPVGLDDGRYIDVDTTIQDTPSFFLYSPLVKLFVIFVRVRASNKMTLCKNR